MQFDPASMNDRDIYRLLVQLVVPRPIAWVSTISKNGITNLAPYSFFNAVGANPPALMFCPVNRKDGTFKDSLANIKSTGEFVVNVVTYDLSDAMNQTSAEFDSEVSEFEAVGIRPAASQCVSPPSVADSIAQFECRVNQIIHLAPGPVGANIVIGDIVMVRVQDQAIDQGGRIDPKKIDAVGRMGGALYTRTTDQFELKRSN